MTTHNRPNSVTRRTVIGGGIAWGLVSAGAHRASALTLLPTGEDDENRPHAELFAFPGNDPATTAIALTVEKGTEPAEIRIHAGCREFAFESSAEKHYSFPVFIGEVMTGAGSVCTLREAVVLQAPNRMLAGVEHTGIWAEIVTARGKRRRVGSPFLVPLLAQSSRVSEAYHTICPEQDREILLEDVADLIAGKAQGNVQIGDARSYGRRLAYRLLPDVLSYDPELPRGFSFAAFNGRYPGEGAAAIVATTLRGAPVFRGTNASPAPVAAFPYFTLPASMA